MVIMEISLEIVCVHTKEICGSEIRHFTITEGVYWSIINEFIYKVPPTNYDLLLLINLVELYFKATKLLNCPMRRRARSAVIQKCKQPD